ncbi:hypothetical protein RJ640_019047 [Escallonia rubra]|uniref:Uncharacterized protein n=1 Tax=Escallonia rubra TaxID=112253 RepID=A0AA88QHE3_9ASTE|nr:hypothetical protein RJ640_019047 [Escallonia rubra]
MGGAQAMKRIPRIKFPQRHPKPSGSTPQHQTISVAGDAPQTFFSGSASSNVTLGGKASLQPKRTPLSQEEIEAILASTVAVPAVSASWSNSDRTQLWLILPPVAFWEALFATRKSASQA